MKVTDTPRIYDHIISNNMPILQHKTDQKQTFGSLVLEEVTKPTRIGVSEQIYSIVEAV